MDPTMLEKALSGLDLDISNILNSEDSDEIKVKNYASALGRFRNYSNPPKPPATASTAASTAVSSHAIAMIPRAAVRTKKKKARKVTKHPKTEPLNINLDAPTVSWSLLDQPDRTHDVSLWR